MQYLFNQRGETMFKKLFPIITAIILIFAFSPIAEAAPTFIKHAYNKNTNVYYYSIKGSKYKTVNHKMKLVAKEINKYDIILKQAAKDEHSEYVYYNKLRPTIKYQKGNRISILTKEIWWAGGSMQYICRSYNLENGKQINLKQAFKSTSAYKKANLQIAKKIDKTFNDERFDKNGVDPFTGKTALQLVDAFYWSEKGLYVVYSSGTVGPSAAGHESFKVSNSYAKYYK